MEQLRINVFNPGDGQLLVEALRAIEQEQITRRVAETTSLLRYSVQMFGEADTQLDQMGQALELVLDPERQAAEGDEFTLATTNHLLPKLVFARNTVGDFLRAPHKYAAHITIFLEHFNARSKLTRIDSLRRGTFVGGLVQEPEIALEPGGDRFLWSKGVKPAPSRDPIAYERELCATNDCVQRLQAATAAGQPQAKTVAPVVSLHLDASSLALLKHSHEISDWVVTVDRHLGVEYFDSGRTSEEFGYLLDFSPATLQGDRPRVMLSTRCGWELAGLLKPIFDRLTWPLTKCRAEIVLEALRSLSGRLAFRLLGSPYLVNEIVGLLLARWLLAHTRVLTDRVIIPLDAHLSWFQKRGDNAAEGNSSSQRADLLLVGFDAATATLRMTVVEVKLREGLSTSERSYLYRAMKEQADSTVTWLRDRFDPQRYVDPRPDALLSARELATTLAFYIRRGFRYGLVDNDTANAALEFVENLDAGYQLDLSSVGVVFEQAAMGNHLDEDEPGFQVYRFGKDVADALFKEATALCDQEPHTVSEVQSPSDGTQAPTSPNDAGSSLDANIESFRSALGVTTPLRKTPVPEAAPPKKEAAAIVQNTVVPSDPKHSAAVTNPMQEPKAEQSPPAMHKDESPPAVKEAKSSVKVPPASVPPLPSPREAALVRADVLLGANEHTTQFGILGKSGEAKVGVDLTGCNTISLFGVQGFGKSYTLGVVAEMAVQPVTGINCLPSPLATVIFHYHKSDAYAPEFVTASEPNRKHREIEALLTHYGARPEGLRDVLVLVPEAKLAQRKAEFPKVNIEPILFSSGELGVESWKFLLGAYGNDALYVRQLIAIMRRHRQGLTIDRFEQEIHDAELSTGARKLAEDRINLARPYLNDTARLGTLLKPGRTIIVDLRDEWIEKEEALGLFVVMLKIFATAKHQGKDFNKLVVFDEAHKYVTESSLISQVVETIREMRHQATSVVIASQDPLSVPRAVIELTSILLLHRMTSPQWLKHLKSAISALDQVSESVLSALQPGEALLWAQRATDKRFTQRPQKITVRPRFSQHGGGTKTAIEGETVR